MPFITSDFERTVGAPIGEVNSTLIGALRGAGFEVTSKSLTSVEARRGSKWAVAAVGAFALKKVPLVASARLAPGEGGCLVAVRLADDWNMMMGDARAAKQRYRDIFAEVQEAIDVSLRQLTPAVHGGEPEEWSNKRTGVFSRRLAERMEKIGDQVARRGGQALAGDWRKAKRPWDEVEQVCLQSSDGVMVLASIELQTMIDTGTMMVTRPDALPANLMAELASVEAHFEHALSSRGGSVTLPLDDAEVPVVTFLRQQAALRSRLAVRTLQECVECHDRRMINPDYQKILKRNQLLKNIGGSFGAGIVNGSVSPFVLFNRVMSFAKLDPDYVCRSCQGMNARESIVTLCPQCGTMQPQAVLTSCSKCGHDFRDALAKPDQPRQPATPPNGTPAAWLPDPAGRHEYRYWDGGGWTEHVSDDGDASTDPIRATS